MTYFPPVLRQSPLMLRADAVAAQQGYNCSKAVQRACPINYHKYCGQYRVETEALRGGRRDYNQSLPVAAHMHLFTTIRPRVQAAMLY
jgi:hypothetical protein